MSDDVKKEEESDMPMFILIGLVAFFFYLLFQINSHLEHIATSYDRVHELEIKK